MHSRADALSRREWFERALRGAALTLMGFALWRLLFAAAGGTLRVDGAGVEHALPSLVASPAAAVHVAFAGTPSPATRDALGAIGRAGTRVTWSGATLVPLAMTAERVREPSAPVRIAVASLGDVELSDAREVLDTVRAGTGATLELAAPSGALTASAQRTHAMAEAAALPALKPVLVLGRASWESKFVVAALEEAGWRVDARLVIAPAADVTQGKLDALDTAGHAAVIALDSALGGSRTALVRFVREGGGLVLLADAANTPSLRAIAPARSGTRVAPVSRDVNAANPWDALPLYPLESIRRDVVRLASRGALTAVAARREGAGRVLQVGFDETWRWRMQGGDEAGAAYRVWWSRLVASVVATPLPHEADIGSAEGAPLARLVEALGPASDAPTGVAPSDRLPPWLVPFVLVMLLAEWSSRRLRGAR